MTHQAARGRPAAYKHFALWLSAVVPIAAPSIAAAQESGGLYTAEQAARGHSIYRAECSTCHGADLRGAGGNPLVGDNFLAAWARLKTTMPPGRSRDISDVQHADVLAYILQKNGFASGATELGSDPAQMATALAKHSMVVLEERPAPPDLWRTVAGRAERRRGQHPGLAVPDARLLRSALHRARSSQP
jgi:mono/diheme cytochrome c family protein